MDPRENLFDIRGRKPNRVAVLEALVENYSVYVRYPCWLYRADCDPLRVNNEDDEKQARDAGYDSITASDLSNKHLVNWVWDLEDMSPKQLRVFAMDEYGVDLPVEADQDTLFKAVLELARCAPQNRNRMILMAHTVQLNYDATLAEIRRLADCDNDDVFVERTYEEVYA